MLPILLAVIPALLAGTTAAAAVAPRDHTCTVEVFQKRGQNPVVGGENSLTCGVSRDYGDGRNDVLSSEFNKIWHAGDHCYSSQLPYSICIHTSSSTDGYLDYGDQHKDFNEDGCKQDHSANPTGDEHTISCTFACA